MYRFYFTFLVGVLLFSSLVSKAQERTLFRRNTQIEIEKKQKNDDWNELPPLQISYDKNQSTGKIIASEDEFKQYTPVRIINPSISNFDTTSVDEGESLVVEIEEQSATLGTDNFVTVASYFSIWDTKNIDPYDIDYRNFGDPVDIQLYNDSKGWAIPTGEIKVTSRFGPRWGRLHAGTDLDLDTGDPVYSTFDGIVRISGYNYRGYGNYIVVRHYNGLETLYGHLSKRLLEPGQFVRAGDEIGKGGNTGRSTGSHLHYETRYEGNPFNPEFVFDYKQSKPRNQHIIITEKTFDKYSLALRNEIGTAGEKVKNRQTTWYTIRRGDTLGGIARKVGLTTVQLARLNGIRTSSTIFPGKRLRIR